MADYEKLAQAFGELDEDTVMDEIDRIIADPEMNAEAAVAACQKGLGLVGDLFESGEYFVGDLIYSGDLMNNAFAKLKPYMGGSVGGQLGKLVICTVKDDLHDIGKNIVKCMLEAGGFEVVDLGIDVAPETIVSAMEESGAKILAMSGVLTLAIESMRKSVVALQEAGIRDKVKVIIGGAPVTEEYFELVGADAWGVNATDTVNICCNWASA